MNTLNFSIIKKFFLREKKFKVKYNFMVPRKYMNYKTSFLSPHPNTLKIDSLDFPGGAVVKNPPVNTRDTGSSPGSERSHMPQSN